MFNVLSLEDGLIIVPIRLRVINIMKTWMKTYYISERDESIRLKLREWANKLPADFPRTVRETLVANIESQFTSDNDDLRIASICETDRVPRPSVHLDIPTDGLRLLGWSPDEIARQITIHQMELFRNIKIRDWVRRTLNGPSSSRNIRIFIDYSDKVGAP